MRLAHDDPRAAARLLLALAPVQRALVPAPLEYDLTIRGTGTYAVSIGPERVATRAIREPRARDQAAFHLSADVATLSEVLAGVEKRMGRWIGSVKVRGRRRDAAALRDALVAADIDLAAAARAGADLDPDLVWRALAYAIDPAWTTGHTFTVAQEISGPRPVRWHIGVRDGAPVTVERRAPAQPPDAVVSMSRARLLAAAARRAGAGRRTSDDPRRSRGRGDAQGLDGPRAGPRRLTGAGVSRSVRGCRPDAAAPSDPGSSLLRP